MPSNVFCQHYGARGLCEHQQAPGVFAVCVMAGNDPRIACRLREDPQRPPAPPAPPPSKVVPESGPHPWLPSFGAVFSKAFADAFGGRDPGSNSEPASNRKPPMRCPTEPPPALPSGQVPPMRNPTPDGGEASTLTAGQCARVTAPRIGRVRFPLREWSLWTRETSTRMLAGMVVLEVAVDNYMGGVEVVITAEHADFAPLSPSMLVPVTYRPVFDQPDGPPRWVV